MFPMLGIREHTVIRRGKPTYVKGVPISSDDPDSSSSPTTFCISASVQPLSQSDLVRELAGLRATHGVRIFAHREIILNTVEDSQAGNNPGQEPDILVYEGREYQIHRRDPWSSVSPLPHVEYIAFASSTGRGVAP